MASWGKDSVEVSGCLATMGSKSMLRSVAQQSNIDYLDDLRFNSLDEQVSFPRAIDQDPDAGGKRH